MTRSPKIPEEEKVRLFRDSIYYEIIHTFGVPVELTNEQLNSHTIGETINFSRRVHGRLLAGFLLGRRDDRGTRQDDAFAEDFGFNLNPADLGMGEDDRKKKKQHPDLNKGLMHLTYGRVTGATRKPWSNQVLKDLLPVTIQFMKHVRDNEGGTLFANSQERDGWEELLTCLERCQEGGRRLRFASGFNGSQTWYKPTTEKGSVAVRYGTEPTLTPGGAVVVESATNTTSKCTISFCATPTPGFR